MPSKHFKYIFGPVYSWRLGISLGIDPVSQEAKICNFDCVYCQLGRTPALCRSRKVFVPTRDIIKEIKEIPRRKIDYVTFSGRGEPTVAKNLGPMIKAVRKLRSDKIAVITNGALIFRKDVQDDLKLADFILVKLDASTQAALDKINRPKNLKFDKIVNGIKNFKKFYSGRLGLQIMFIPTNKGQARALAEMARTIGPDEIQLNTPLRKSPVQPLSRAEMKEIKDVFKGFKVRMVYSRAQKDVKPINKDSMIKRHGTPA